MKTGMEPTAWARARTSTARLLSCALPLAFAALAACGGVPEPTDQLSLARNSIDQATAAGAADGAPTELASAQDKFARAQEAIKGHDNLLARRLAEESQTDAELAISKAQVTRSQRALAELDQTNRALQSEIDRETAQRENH